ncbi:UvrABC system protein A [Planctomycetes bacterium LzC2]|uniref:UvrABC system protein A n=2 Tax=Alienimonas chondri TaxID=2681879 RepID=A0ABX1V7Q0_9PLAN|nr:UvrABC system protein A [Alienimonas chondri]
MHERPPIRVVGARVHNLRNVSVEFPAGELTVLSGVSGSGKSSLAFDTVHAEGQRRFLATASPKARAAVAKLDRPEVDAVENLPPVIAIGQSDPTAGPRTTLATLVGLHDLFRLLWAGAGVPHDPETGDPLVRHTVRQVVDRIFALPERTKLMVLAPAGEAVGAEDDRVIYEQALKEGFVRCDVGGESFETAELAAGEATPSGAVGVVIDRAIVKPGAEDRVRESVDLAASRSGGAVSLRFTDADAPGGWQTEDYRTRLIDPATGGERRPLTPQSFSFHSPRGACPACGGTGLADPDAQASRLGLPAPCPACDGQRLNPESLATRLDGLTIGGAARLSVDAAAERFAALEARATDGKAELSAGGDEVVARLLPEVSRLFTGLRKVGLGYLTLDRRAGTLSGGEYRRSRLAGALGERTSGGCFVLDEPTVGLHPADADRLWEALVELRDAGNTVLLVEHDPDLIRRADRLIDLGPGAGAEGGTICDTGTPAEVFARGDSPTALAVAGESGTPARNTLTPPRESLTLADARLHSLQGVTLRVPHGRLTAVTGVSGSGKSSLVAGLLVPAVRAALSPSAHPPPASFYGSLLGLEPIGRLAEVDQSRLGGSARSCPATASGVWTEIRKLLARTRDARRLGFTASRFSPANRAGRCPECRGRGFRTLKMDFLPSSTTVCGACRGARFNPQTLAVRWKGRTAGDLLAMRAGEAAETFAEVTPIARVLETFVEVGLGYLPLGQPASTLSGGEAQRVRLAAALADPGATPTLFVLDEPTAGLHPLDVARLTELLLRLVERGHTALCVEHDPDLIARCDHIVELGPGAGPAGGRLIAEGTPREIAERETPTGAALAARFARTDR